jgi:hypothetical protein
LKWWWIFKPEKKHIMQEEKGDPTCLGFLSLCKLYAPVGILKNEPIG